MHAIGHILQFWRQNRGKFKAIENSEELFKQLFSLETSFLLSENTETSVLADSRERAVSMEQRYSTRQSITPAEHEKALKVNASAVPDV